MTRAALRSSCASIAACVAACVLACGPARAPQPAAPKVVAATPKVDPPLDPDDAAVYTRVLSERLRPAGAPERVDEPPERVLIGKETRVDAGCFDADRSSRLHRAMPTLRVSTLGAFLAQNAESIALSSLPTSPLAASFLDADATSTALDAAHAQEAWGAIGARFPGAAHVVVLSRVGFDESRRDALVYYQHAAPSRPTIGYALHLVKTGEGAAAAWTIFDEATCGAS